MSYSAKLKGRGHADMQDGLLGAKWIARGGRWVLSPNTSPRVFSEAIVAMIAAPPYEAPSVTSSSQHFRSTAEFPCRHCAQRSRRRARARHQILHRCPRRAHWPRTWCGGCRSRWRVGRTAQSRLRVRSGGKVKRSESLITIGRMGEVRRGAIMRTSGSSTTPTKPDNRLTTVRTSADRTPMRTQFDDDGEEDYGDESVGATAEMSQDDGHHVPDETDARGARS